MIDAYQSGIPGNGKPFPDGARMAKIHWTPKKLETFPTATVPARLHDVDFMVKDSKRFADSGGWGWGAFKYDAASDTFTPATTADKPPQGNDAKCGLACHTIVKTTRLRVHGLREAVNENRPAPPRDEDTSASSVQGSPDRVEQGVAAKQFPQKRQRAGGSQMLGEVEASHPGHAEVFGLVAARRPGELRDRDQSTWTAIPGNRRTPGVDQRGP